MGAWVHGCMGAWVHGCMGAWVHGCMGAWVQGSMGAWAHVGMGAWVHRGGTVVHRGASGCIGVHRGASGCMGVHGGAWGCMGGQWGCGCTLFSGLCGNARPAAGSLVLVASRRHSQVSHPLPPRSDHQVGTTTITTTITASPPPPLPPPLPPPQGRSVCCSIGHGPSGTPGTLQRYVTNDHASATQFSPTPGL